MKLQNIYLQDQPKFRNKPDGKPMVFGQNSPQINGSKKGFSLVVTVREALIGYNSLGKCTKPPMIFSLEIRQNLEKSLMVSPWFLIKFAPNRLFQEGF